MLLINRYTCPMKEKVSIQAHLIEDKKLVKSWGKMDIADIDIFSKYDFVLIVDVVRAKNLTDVNITSGGEL